MSYYRIAAQKSLPPAYNLLAKICSARRPPGRNGFLSVNCRPGESSKGDPIMKNFLWGRRYFNKRQTYQIQDYLSLARIFHGGDILTWHRSVLSSSRRHLLATGWCTRRRITWWRAVPAADLRCRASPALSHVVDCAEWVQVGAVTYRPDSRCPDTRPSYVTSRWLVARACLCSSLLVGLPKKNL